LYKIGQNPNKEFLLFKVEFLNENFINYPNPSEIENYSNKNRSLSLDEVKTILIIRLTFNFVFKIIFFKKCLDFTMGCNKTALIEKILSKDPLSELSEIDKGILRNSKRECLQKYINSLPKLLQAIDWSNKLDVIEVNIFNER